MTNSKTPFTPVPSQPDFRQLEQSILQKWKEEKVFEQTQTRPADKEYVFYEGPPTANGKPAIHHVLARSFKDLFPRFKVMQGHHVTRKGGWDTHGLPVEISVEKKLGWLGRNHGASREELEEFNRLCRTSVWETIQDWNELTERMGYWLDLENPYVTYHNEYVESVWNLLKRLHEFATHELTLAHEQMMLLGRRTAEEKLICFLLDMQQRWARLGKPSVTVPLPMTRQDIADFLGLTIETVSRTFTRLAKEKTILIVPGGVRVMNPERMSAVAA